MARRASHSKDGFTPYHDNDADAIPLTETVRGALPLYEGESSKSVGSSAWLSQLGRKIGNLIQRPPRYIILGLVAFVLVTLFGSLRTSAISEIVLLQSEDDPLHPIQQLASKGDAAFQNLVKKQSKTVKEAVREYRRRYGRRPPPAFGKWFALAQNRGLILVDEFDTMMNNLEPFWGINPTTVRERVQNMAQAPHVFSMTLNSTGFHNTTDYWQVDTIRAWLDEMPWQDIVHDVEFLMDTMDEPTINVPYNSLQHALTVASTQKSSIDARSPEIPRGDTELSWHNFKNTNSWEYMLSSCSPTDAAAGSTPVVDASTAFPDFVTDVTVRMDPCADPGLHRIHGIWSSPVNLLLTKHLVPVFSQARASRMNDILYPSPFYSLRMDDSVYIEKDDIPWEQKHDRAYWVGTGNGGMSTTENWKLLQRQRMAILTASDNTDTVALLEPKISGSGQREGWIRRPNTSWSDLSEMFHIRIGQTATCEPEACKIQEEYFKPQRESASESLTSKYVLDIDGMSFSGRYYRLLKSNCAVLKQTIFEEWHDKWLVPWVHYIPISLAAGELGEVVRFLVEEPAGQEIGRNIAQQGREWSRKVLRKEDLKLVFLRLLMEYERVVQDDRNDLFYVNE